MKPSTPPLVPPGEAHSRATRNVVWTASSYVGEGLPWSFMHQMATEYLTAIRAPLAQVGFTSLLHLGTTLKFIWSPVVDLFGTKRGWMLAMQAAMGLLMVAIAAGATGGTDTPLHPDSLLALLRGLLGAGGGAGADPAGTLAAAAAGTWAAADAATLRPDLLLFWGLLSLVAVLSATHDIACDGFYMTALDRKGQALYSGVRVAAFRGAMIVGSSGFVVLAGRTSWRLGFSAAGLAMLLVALSNASLLPRPETAPGAPARGRVAGQFLETYRSFLAQPNALVVLSFLFFFRLGDIMMFAMAKPLLRDIGMDTATRGLLNGVGTGVTIAASMMGGALIAARGLERTLVPIVYLQNLAIPLYVALALLKPGFAGVTVVVVLEQLAAGLGTAAHVVFMMQRCRSAFSASHYAFATAVVGLSSTLIGGVSGYVNGALGHPWYFALAFVASWPSLILVWLVPRAPIE